MACLTNCGICGHGLINDTLCNECEGVIAEMAMNGEGFDEDVVKKKVQDARHKKSQREMKEHLDSLCDAMGRNNWRQHRDRADSLQGKINDAIEQAKVYTGIPEIDAVRKILERK